MSNELCSPFNCNICLMFESYQKEFQSAKKTLLALLSCSGCHLVRYCTTEHQKLDWPIHRQFCRAVQKIKQDLNVVHPFYINGVPQNRKEIEKATVQLKYLLRNALDRNLEYHEEELSSFPPYCGQCFKFKNLKVVCVKCFKQPYCTEEHRELHKEAHAKLCELLQVYYCPYKVQPLNTEICMTFDNKIEDLDKLDLVECIEKLFSIKLPLKPYQTMENYQLFSWSADFSCIMTICYAINRLNKQNYDFAKFKVFILGASVEAVLWFREIHCKLFFLQNPQITELILEFIGPELVEPEYQELRFSFLGADRLIKFKIFKGLFQDYCKYYKADPSLIVAFNCGFSEFSQCYDLSPNTRNLNTLESLDSACDYVNAKDTWFQGLIEILQTYDTPIIFTSFTEQESQFDFAALKSATVKQSLKVHIERIFKVSKNPFRDLRPLRQWYTRDTEEFYHRNGYIQAIRTKL